MRPAADLLMNLPFRAGHYEVAALLGRGGMGVVYRATDTRTGTTVALKSLPSADPAALMRFKQEFRSLADISHPNLAALFELFAVDETWWLAMECVEGTDFLSYVRGEALRPEPSSSSDNEQTSEVHDCPWSRGAGRAFRTWGGVARPGPGSPPARNDVGPDVGALRAARQRHAASRREAVERHGRLRRPHRAARLRTGHRAVGATRERRIGAVRHRVVHGAGTGSRPGADARCRLVRRRRHVVRGAGRTPSLQRTERRRDRAEARRGAAFAAHAVR